MGFNVWSANYLYDKLDFFDLCFTEGLKDPLIFGAVSDSLFWFNLQQVVLSKMVNYLSIDNNNVVW